MSDADQPGPTGSLPQRPAADELRGALFMLVAILCFAVGFAIVKYLTAELPEPVIGLFRSVFALLCFLPLAIRRGPRFFATKRPFDHLWRSMSGAVSFLCFLYALGRMPLGDAVAISFTAPLWSILLAVVIFAERPALRLWLAVVAGLAGVVLVAQASGSGEFGLGAIFALGNAILSAVSMMLVKRLSGTEPPDRVAFYFMTMAAAMAGLLSIFDWKTPEAHHWPFLVVLGGIFYVGQVCLTRAYYYGSMSRVAPLDFLRLPASVAVGYLWFGEVPAALAVGGMALILLAALDILFAARGRAAKG